MPIVTGSRQNSGLTLKYTTGVRVTRTDGDIGMLNIGKVARQGGVTVETLRYYEREGLVAVSDRDANGYRRYADDVVRQVRFIKRAQDVGFTLKDIKELLSLRADPGASCCDVRARADAKIREMEAKIAVLRRMKAILQDWAATCPDAGPVDQCPILDALDGETEDVNGHG